MVAIANPCAGTDAATPYHAHNTPHIQPSQSVNSNKPTPIR
jgi:hypothetical protein